VTYRAHLDCDEVADEMKRLAGIAWNYDEDAYPLIDTVCEREDGPWIKEKFPEVAKRLWTRSVADGEQLALDLPSPTQAIPHLQ
jgi:hypothetical protein